MLLLTLAIFLLLYGIARMLGAHTRFFHMKSTRVMPGVTVTFIVIAALITMPHLMRGVAAVGNTANTYQSFIDDAPVVVIAVLGLVVFGHLILAAFLARRDESSREKETRRREHEAARRRGRGRLPPPEMEDTP